jgi:hypothetical protein
VGVGGKLVQSDKLRSAAELKSLDDAIDALTADATAKKDHFKKAVEDAQRQVTTSFVTLAQKTIVLAAECPCRPFIFIFYFFCWWEIGLLPRSPACRQVWMSFRGGGVAAC